MWSILAIRISPAYTYLLWCTLGGIHKHYICICSYFKGYTHVKDIVLLDEVRTILWRGAVQQERKKQPRGYHLHPWRLIRNALSKDSANGKLQQSLTAQSLVEGLYVVNICEISAADVAWPVRRARLYFVYDNERSVYSYSTKPHSNNKTTIASSLATPADTTNTYWYDKQNGIHIHNDIMCFAMLKRKVNKVGEAVIHWLTSAQLNSGMPTFLCERCSYIYTMDRRVP